MTKTWCDHERLNPEIWKYIGVEPGQSVIVCQPFRWFRNGEVIPNAYEMFSVETVCRDNGWEIVASYGPHIAVVQTIL